MYITKDKNEKPVLHVGQSGNNFVTINYEGKMNKHFSDEKVKENLIVEKRGPVKNRGKKFMGDVTNK